MKILSLNFLALSLLASSCVYSPLSRSFYKWSSEVCSRKTFFGRLCSGTVLVFMFPVYLGAVIIDIPLGMLEFFFGIAPFKDPLVKTSSLDFEPRQFQGNKPEEQWLVQRLKDSPDSFEVQKIAHGQLIDSFVMTPTEGGRLKVYASVKSYVAQKAPKDLLVAELASPSLEM